MKTIIPLLILILLFGCSQTNEQAEKLTNEPSERTSREKATEFDFQKIIYSMDPNKALADSHKRFIRSGDIKFKCDDVFNTTQAIETYVNESMGYVAKTDLNTRISSSSEIKVSKDSIIESTQFITTNYLTLRIPNERLNSTLSKIATHITFLDHRALTANDVSLELKAKYLKQHRLRVFQERQKSNRDQHNHESEHKTHAEQLLLEKGNTEDETVLQKMKIEDEIAYSTIDLLIYQNEKTITSKKLIPHSITPFEASFSTQLASAMKNGWLYVKLFIVFLITVWPLWGVCLLVFGIWKKNHKR